MKPIKTLSKYIDLLEKKKVLDEEIEIIRNQAMDEMSKAGLKQIKTDKATASIVKRVNYDVNETEFRRWADEQPNLELDMFYVTLLDKKRVTEIGEKQLKQTGEIVPFMAAREIEYISIRNNK